MPLHESRIMDRSVLLMALLPALLLGLSGCKASKVGMEYYNKGDYEQARSLLYEAIHQEPEMAEEVLPFYVDSVLRIADRLSREERYESALQALQQARTVARDHADLRRATVRVHLQFAEQLLNEGNLELAQAHIDEARRLNPSSMEARRLQGRLTIDRARLDARRGQYESALKRFGDYLREFPEDEEIRNEVAEVFVQRGQELDRLRHHRDAAKVYAAALAYAPGNERAVRLALQSATAAGGGLVENYRYLLEQAPNDDVLRRQVVAQLHRRAEDSLDARDPASAIKFIGAAYDLDRERERRLSLYERFIDRVVTFQYDRGETASAAQTLVTAGNLFPPLQSNFEERAKRLQESERIFFLSLEEDLGLLNTFLSDVEVALSLRNDLNDLQRRRARLMIDTLASQKRALDIARRAHNRVLLESRPFLEPPHDAMEFFREIVGEQKYNRYRELLSTYRERK